MQNLQIDSPRTTGQLPLPYMALNTRLQEIRQLWPNVKGDAPACFDVVDDRRNMAAPNSSTQSSLRIQRLK